MSVYIKEDSNLIRLSPLTSEGVMEQYHQYTPTSVTMAPSWQDAVTAGYEVTILPGWNLIDCQVTMRTTEQNMTAMGVNHVRMVNHLNQILQYGISYLSSQTNLPANIQHWTYNYTSEAYKTTLRPQYRNGYYYTTVESAYIKVFSFRSALPGKGY